jgi:ankyrin repeat protein
MAVWNSISYKYCLDCFNVIKINKESKMTNEKRLLEAIRYGKTKKVKMLIEAGTNLNWRNECGSTALILAVRWGNSEIVKMLIEAKADLNLKDEDGNTPLIWAARWDYAEIAKMLEEAQDEENSF